jgi:hypothetical protein
VVIPIQESKDMARALERHGNAEVKHTWYKKAPAPPCCPGMTGHASYDVAYADPEVSPPLQ